MMSDEGLSPMSDDGLRLRVAAVEPGECGSCRFFAPLVDEDEHPIMVDGSPVGECRLMAPVGTVLLETDEREDWKRDTGLHPSHQELSSAMFPVTRDTDWCGQHTPRGGRPARPARLRVL